MKTYKSSDLVHKRAEVMQEAEKGGVIIQRCNTNGDLVREFVMMKVDEDTKKLMNLLKNKAS